MGIQFYLPIAIAAGLFFLVQFLTRKNINNDHFVRIRILPGCVYVGYLINEIANTDSIRSIVTLILLAGVIILAVYNLQKRYFVLKDPK